MTKKGAEVFRIEDYRGKDKRGKETEGGKKEELKKKISAELRIKEMEESRIKTSESIRDNLMLKGEDALKDAVKIFKNTGFSLKKVMESVKNMALTEDLKREGKSDDEIQKLTVEIFNSIK